MDLIQAIILGLVQGATEFLPISSTAHIRVLPALLGWADPGAAFTAVIQMGTLIAVLIYFRRDLWSAFSAWARSFKGGEAARTPEARLGWAIFVGTLPIVAFGFVFKDQIETGLRSLYVIAWTLIGMGVLLAVAEVVGQRKRDLNQVTVSDGLWVGFWQAVALIPGASRSGSTITGGLFGGLDRPTAARFSFLLSVPAILAAGVFSMKEHYAEMSGPLLMPVLVANVAAFISGYAAIAFLIKFLQTHNTFAFVFYRVGLGAVLLFLLNTGRLDPNAGLPIVTSGQASRAILP